MTTRTLWVALSPGLISMSMEGALAAPPARPPKKAKVADTRFEAGLHPDDSTGIRFELPYTMGTHKGEARSVSGEAKIRLSDLSVISADLKVPVESIRTGDEKMDCHMWESLGLDYEKSAFPESHVCNDNQLPKQGPDSIAHREIRFEWIASKALGDPKDLDAGNSVAVELEGRWTIHGVTRPGKATYQVSRAEGQPGALRIEGRQDFQLADFGIEVKPFLVIKAKGGATAVIDLILRPAPSVLGLK